MAVRSPINWRTCAQRLAELLPRERLHPAVAAWARGETAATGPWVVALSGGADSIALLLLLWAHWPERRRGLRAIHFNHRLRGAAATADERFCERVCAALGVRYACGAWSNAPKDASEATARAARHAFFTKQMRRWRARALWFGHQQDDIAESMFMRLARGSGLGGLGAPRPVQTILPDRVHLRPLLTVPKTEIIRLLQMSGAKWREDATNRERKFLRNRIRLELIPAWRAAAGDRDALAGISLSRELIDEDDQALEAWLGEISPITSDGSLNLRRLSGKPKGLVRRALHLWLSSRGGSGNLSRQAFTALLNDVLRERQTRHSLDAAHLVQIGRWTARIVDAPRKISKRFQRPVN